jgi:8-oxo-dGTP pyrophosphatase MutT (NUDIX family)
VAADGPVDQECVEGYLYLPGPFRFLLFRRGPDRGRIWVPVSGKVEATDRDFAEALRREIWEETGFSALGPFGELDWHVRFEGPDGRRWRLHAFAVPLEGPWSPRLSAEHEAFAWCDPAEAVRRLHYGDNRAAVQRLLARLSPRPTEPGMPRAPPSPPPPPHA